MKASCGCFGTGRVSRGWVAAALALGLSACNGEDYSLDCSDQEYELCDVRDSECQDAVYAEVRCLRGGAGSPRRPEVMTLDTAALREFFGVDGNASPPDNAEPSPEEIRFERVERALSLVGLVDFEPPPEDPEQDPEPTMAETEVFLAGLLGFYSGQSRSIVLVERPDVAFDTPLAVATLAHEFVHAIQDEIYDLAASRAAKAIGHDASLAMTSLIEGEAMVIERMHRARITGEGLAEWTSAFRDSTAYADEKAVSNPSPLWTSAFAFPYTYGAFGVATVWDAAGPAGVQAMWDAPATTSQRYMADRFEVAPVGKQIRVDTPPLPEDSYEVIADDVMGAWLVHAFVSRALAQGVQAPDLALHWRGDRITVVRNPETDEMAVVWRQQWASSAAAKSFSTAVEAAPSPRGLWEVRRQGKTTVVVATETRHELLLALSETQWTEDGVEPTPRLALSRAPGSQAPGARLALPLGALLQRTPLQGCVADM